MKMHVYIDGKDHRGNDVNYLFSKLSRDECADLFCKAEKDNCIVGM